MGIASFGTLILGNLSMAALQVLSCGPYPRITPVTNSHDKSENGCNAPSQMNEFRCRMEASTSLGLVKRFANGLLNAAGLGVTMTMLLRRSPAETAEGARKGLSSKALRPTI